MMLLARKLHLEKKAEGQHGAVLSLQNIWIEYPELCGCLYLKEQPRSWLFLVSLPLNIF